MQWFEREKEKKVGVKKGGKSLSTFCLMDERKVSGVCDA